jgi:hypothetical protein
MRGDYRALYLAWLADQAWYADREDDDEDEGEEDQGQASDELEPPVPPGLANLTASQRALADFLRIDDDLLAVAASASAGEPPATPSRSEMEAWVKALPAADKDSYLVRFLVEEGDMTLRAELGKRFRESIRPVAKGSAGDPPRRTVTQLQSEREELYEKKTRQAAELEARNRARRERDEAKARAAYLQDLSRREPDVWREVDSLIAAKRPKDYDHAVALLSDLQEVAARSGRAGEVAQRIRELKQRHANKPSLMDRFEQKKLGG